MIEANVNIKEATRIVDNPPPINWEWLAGFFQAEGSPYSDKHPTPYNPNYCRPACNFSQKGDHEILRLIWQFLRTESITAQDAIKYHQVKVNGKRNVENFLSIVAPYLLGNLRTRTYMFAQSFDLTLPEITTPMDWDFVTGFWEGDGTPDTNHQTPIVRFIQSDTQVLQPIRDFVGKGNTQPKSDGSYHLNISDSSKTHPLMKTLLKHARLHYRRVQLAGIILGDGDEL